MIREIGIKHSNMMFGVCDRFISAMLYSTFELLEVQSHRVVFRVRCCALTVAVTLNVKFYIFFYPFLKH